MEPVPVIDPELKLALPRNQKWDLKKLEEIGLKGGLNMLLAARNVKLAHRALEVRIGLAVRVARLQSVSLPHIDAADVTRNATEGNNRGLGLALCDSDYTLECASEWCVSRQVSGMKPTAH